MNPRVKSVKAENNYVLLLEFDNGERKRFDVSPYIGKGVFEPLSDVSFFRRVTVFLGSIQWPNGADLCPDTLYLDSISIAVSPIVPNKTEAATNSGTKIATEYQVRSGDQLLSGKIAELSGRTITITNTGNSGQYCYSTGGNTLVCDNTLTGAVINMFSGDTYNSYFSGLFNRIIINNFTGTLMTGDDGSICVKSGDMLDCNISPIEGKSGHRCTYVCDEEENGECSLGHIECYEDAQNGTPYTLPTATTTTLGGVKLGSDIVQSETANSPSTNTGKTYPVQVDDSGKLVVNIPRTNTWMQNTKLTAGYVTAPSTSNPNKYRGTDLDGNPGRRTGNLGGGGITLLSGENDKYCKYVKDGGTTGIDCTYDAGVADSLWSSATGGGGGVGGLGTENDDDDGDKAGTTTTIFPMNSDYNVNIGGSTITSYKLNVNGNFAANPGNTDAYKNIPEVVINTTGVRMFGGIDYYRYTTVNNQQKKMRGLSVNGPILAGTSGNYIIMYANGSSSGDQYRSYEILGNNELAVGTRAGAFIYFAERTGKYAEVITGGSNTGTNSWPAITGMAQACELQRGASTPQGLGLVGGDGASCGDSGQWTIPERTARNYVNPQDVGIITQSQKNSVYKSLMVGVNTNDPQATLDVNGSIRIGNNCIDKNLECTGTIVGTMMYLERKSTYKGSMVVCMADGVRVPTDGGIATIKYARYDMIYGITGNKLSDLGFENNDITCKLPKPNRGVYPYDPTPAES